MFNGQKLIPVILEDFISGHYFVSALGIIDPKGNPPMPSNRISRLFDLMKSSDLNALVLNPSPTTTYFSGLGAHLSERPTVLILSPQAEPIIILPEFEAGNLRHLPIPLKPFTYGENPAAWAITFQEACQYTKLDGATVGVEPTHMRVLELNFLQTAAPSARFVSAEALISRLRMVKDDEEVDCMRTAVRIAQEAFKETLLFVKAGKSEKQVAAELTYQLLRHGSETSTFSAIVASGPNGADPHAGPSDRLLAPGDLVVVDWGASYKGYQSDITRTLVIGEPLSEQEVIASIVAKANTTARAAAKTGATAKQVDEAARTVIEQAGYGKQFIHRTGHGLGLEVHEHPYLYKENNLVLESGMAVTIEPGIYFVGDYGIRIEDDVIIRDGGGETLTDLPRKLIRIP
jgi:Xaa-Pro dipeptidase